MDANETTQIAVVATKLDALTKSVDDKLDGLSGQMDVIMKDHDTLVRLQLLAEQSKDDHDRLIIVEATVVTTQSNLDGLGKKVQKQNTFRAWEGRVESFIALIVASVGIKQ